MCIFDKLHEECGVFGIFDYSNNADVISDSYNALYALQHRGQESCGIAINNDGVIQCHKDVGLVNEVFTHNQLEKLGEGNIAVAHARYATTGNKTRTNAQPMLVNHHKGTMALAHNGNLVNAQELREELEMGGAIFHSTSDTEVIAYIITQERLRCNSIEEAVLATMKRIKGAYSLVIMSAQKLIAARDPKGFRPLCMGKREDATVFASESCALDVLGAELVRDIKPGEVVVVSQEGIKSLQFDEKHDSSLCVFEFIYFARPDSIIEGSSVHKARLRAGAFLAQEHPVEADLVIGVPDSGIDAAIGYSRESGIPYGIGLIKNKYIARTFIQPGQKQRTNSVKIKLNAISHVIKGKRIVLVDDSVVRGTTSARLVKILRDAGAKEVHMRLSSPPFMHPCYFGTDIDSRENLIAANYSLEEIKNILKVDSIGYLNVAALPHLADNSKCGYCTGCFTGNYPVAPPANTEKLKFEQRLSNKMEKTI